MTETTSGKLAAYPRYARDFLADTRHLSLAARGAYGDLLDHQWLQGSVPDDLVLLARILGCNRVQTARVWAAIEDMFPVSKDGLRRNRRLERERVAAQGRIARAKKGAEAKHHPSSAQAGPKQVLEPCITVSVSGSVTEQPPPTPASVGLPEEFSTDLAAVLRTAQHPEVVCQAIRTLATQRHPQMEAVSPEDVGQGLRALLLDRASTAKLARYVHTAHLKRTKPFPDAVPRAPARGKPDPLAAAQVWAAKEDVA